MTRLAILIAVEKYANKIQPVQYAEADAQGLSNAFEQHGISKTDQILLLSDAATKTTIESRVRKLIQSLAEDDCLYFYYAGHGFAKNAENYITCYDTDKSDLVNTSIKVQWLFDLFRKSKCEKITMFLDSCESGIEADPKIRGIYSELDEDELSDFFDASKHCICFAACKPGQESHSASKLKHGIWTYHVIEALNAEAPGALERKRYLTSSSLQNYLAREVPKTVRNTLTGRVIQTPWFYGAQSSDFLVADVKHILDAREKAANPHINQLKQIILRGERGMSITRLSGFNKKKGHFVPDDASPAANSFVAKVASDELVEDLDEVYDSIKSSFHMKRREISTHPPYDGAGSIITPYFDYEVSVRVNPEDTSEVLWVREITNIREPNILFSEEFDKAFGGTFTLLEFSATDAIDVEGIVDQIEDLDDDRIQVDCDREGTLCTIRVEGLDANIIITPGAFQIERKAGRSPKALIEGFFAAQKLLVDEHKLKQLPFQENTK